MRCLGLLVSFLLTMSANGTLMEDEAAGNIATGLLSDQTVEAVAEESKATLVSLGEYTITYYCPCMQCCGKTDGITATGTLATEDRTVAVDPKVIPLGSEMVIEGKSYIAEDVGGAIKGQKIDIYVNSHQEALNRGRQRAEVHLVAMTDTVAAGSRGSTTAWKQ